MAKTHADAEKQTAIMEEGRGHHIGDFLPPEELKKFMNKYKVLLSTHDDELNVVKLHIDRTLWNEYSYIEK